MKRRLIAVVLVLVLALMLATAVAAATSPGWRDSQAILWPRDRLYVYCAAGYQVIKPRPNVTIITCHAMQEAQ